ncbi:MAG: hypothetical protein IJV27_05270 [Prevotella sp.]|nr:hypothetical protein [Prevotella sp.]
MRAALYKAFGLSLFITIGAIWFHWDKTGWCLLISALFLIILVMAEFLINKMKTKAERDGETPYGNYVYWDYESEPGCWAHNDSLSGLTIYRKDSVVLSKENNTDEGWLVVEKKNSEPQGACLEEENTLEIRKNGVTIQYCFFWKRKFEWLLQYDIVRMLYDKKYYESILTKAENGDADSQTLVGCCYGHNGKMSLGVVEHNIKAALIWWHKAAEQGHRYAMRELALYHWHKGEHDKALYWWKKGKLDIFIIKHYYQYHSTEINNGTDLQSKEEGK